MLHLKKDIYLPRLSDYTGSELGEVFRNVIGVTRYFMEAAGQHHVSMCSATCLFQGRPDGLRGSVPPQLASAMACGCSASGYLLLPPPPSSTTPRGFLDAFSPPYVSLVTKC